MYITFFSRMAFIFAARNFSKANYEIEDEKKAHPPDFEGLQKKILAQEYICFNEYLDHDCFSSENLAIIFSFLDTLNGSGIRYLKVAFDGDIEQPLYSFSNFIERKKEEKKEKFLKVSILCHALVKFVTSDSFESIDRLEFRRWIRIVRNLVENAVENAPIDSFPKVDSFPEAIAAIDTLFDESEEGRNILGCLSEGMASGIKAFTIPLAEEIMKAKLITSQTGWQAEEDEWEKAISRADNHGFFKGKIGFLLANDVNDNDLKKFQMRYSNAARLFDKGGICSDFKTDDKLVLRAFVSYCDWEHLFKFDYDENPNTWKKILSIEELQPVLEKILDNECLNLDFLKQSIETESSFPKQNKATHEDLYKTDLLTKTIRGCRLTTPGEVSLLYPYNGKARWGKYIIGQRRNVFLSKLIEAGEIVLEYKNQQLEDLPFFWGWNIEFTFQGELLIFDGSLVKFNGKQHNLDALDVDWKSEGTPEIINILRKRWQDFFEERV